MRAAFIALFLEFVMAPDFQASDFPANAIREDSASEGAFDSSARERARGIELGGLSLVEFCARLGAATPTLGALSGAGAAAALGTALLSMAFRRPLGEGAPSKGVFRIGRADELDVLTLDVLAALDRGAAARKEYRQARALEPQGAAAESSARAARERAARTLVEVPLEIIESALAGLRMASAALASEDLPDVAETEAGALVLWSALEACTRIVHDNLACVEAANSEFASQHALVLPALIEEGARLLARVRRGSANDREPA